MADQIICSFRVDKDASVCGFPWCCPGRQPTVSVPPFYPDQAKPFLAPAEAEKLFEKLNRIFLETGCPPLPLMVTPFPIIILSAIVGFATFASSGSGQLPIAIYLAPVVLLTFIGGFCVIFWMASSRRRRIEAEIASWNQAEGAARGLHLALGGEGGAAPDQFWMSWRMRRPRYNTWGGNMARVSSPMIHLYVNPSARQEWENSLLQKTQPQQQQQQPTAPSAPGGGVGGGGWHLDQPPPYSTVIQKE